MSIQDKIKSMRDMVSDARQYIRPDPEKLDTLNKNLFENEDALSYLKTQRGLAEDTIRNFQLGYDIERNAIAIPIFKNGELINIRYRHIAPKEKQPKYIQEKDCEVWMYNEQGIDVGLKKGAVLVVEGEFDCMSAWQSGIKNVVSPASGKDSYGVWLELLDPVPEVYIAYDNDKPGKEASYKFAERIGVEKCREVTYPDDVKDANDYFQKFKREDFIELVKESRPFYTRRYNDLFDVINLLRDDTHEKLQLDILPGVKLAGGQLVSISADTNVGKTQYTLNIAKKLVEKEIPCLILPFERGIQVVGSRFLQVFLERTEEELRKLSTDEWEKTIRKVSNTPIYFSLPSPTELVEVIKKAKRILGVKAVLVDHLDYMIRNSGEREDVEIRNRLHELKSLAIEEDLMLFVVTHIRRIQQPGVESKKKPTLHDIRGSSAVAQDSETVIILDRPDDNLLEVDIQKNKGKMLKKVFNFDPATGVLGEESGLAMSLDDI